MNNARGRVPAARGWVGRIELSAGFEMNPLLPSSTDTIAFHVRSEPAEVVSEKTCLGNGGGLFHAPRHPVGPKGRKHSRVERRSTRAGLDGAVRRFEIAEVDRRESPPDKTREMIFGEQPFQRPRQRTIFDRSGTRKRAMSTRRSGSYAACHSMTQALKRGAGAVAEGLG